jgi:hypothetical protein
MLPRLTNLRAIAAPDRVIFIDCTASRSAVQLSDAPHYSAPLRHVAQLTCQTRYTALQYSTASRSAFQPVRRVTRHYRTPLRHVAQLTSVRRATRHYSTPLRHIAQFNPVRRVTRHYSAPLRHIAQLTSIRRATRHYSTPLRHVAHFSLSELSHGTTELHCVT